MGKTINFRALAGVAVSAATLLALAPFGVANAAEGDAINIPTAATETLTVKAPAGKSAQIEGHKFAALRLGSYTAAIEGSTSTAIKSVSVGTESNVKNAATAALKDAKNGDASAAAGFEGNPVGEISSLAVKQETAPYDSNSTSDASGAELRKFVTNMMGQSDVKNLFNGSSVAVGTATSGAATITVAPGVYMIEDVTDDTTLSGNADRASVPMLVPSTITPAGAAAPFSTIGTGDHALQLGVVNMKLDDKLTVDKALTAINGNSSDLSNASIGSKLSYKLSSNVPMTTSFSKFRYVLTDQPSAAGLNYDASSAVVKIGTETVDPSDYTVTEAKLDDSNHSTKYVIFDLSRTVMKVDATRGNPGDRYYAYNDPVEITYNMTLNDSARDGSIGNGVKLAYSNNSQPSKQPTTDETNTSDPSNPANSGTTGIDPNGVPTQGGDNGTTTVVDGNNTTPGQNGGNETHVYFRHFYVQTRAMTHKDDTVEPPDDPTGAVFNVFPTGAGAQSGDPYRFVKATSDSDGSYMLASDQNADSTVSSPDLTVKSSDRKGSLKIDGLANGTYLVKETKPADGYSNATLPSFKVTVSSDSSDPSKTLISNTSDFFSLVEILGKDNPVDAGTDAARNPIHVYFATNLSQLPLTGGAGIILAVLLAMALAAAAGSLYVVKRRETAGNAVAGGAKIIR